MMYHKALLFGDVDVAAQIEHEQDPGRAKCVDVLPLAAVASVHVTIR
jgi:hypothetical protein